MANASDLINLWSANGGSLDATNFSAIQGKASDIETLYTSSGITGLGNEDITLFYSIFNATHFVVRFNFA